MRVRNAPPHAGSMLESLRGLGYALPTALADLVDNSIAANAGHVAIHLEWAGPESWVSIVDNGDGKYRKVGGASVNMLKRRRTTEHADRYSIKTLISPRDQAIDLTEAEWNAALELSQKTWRNDTDRNEGKAPPSEPRGLQIRHVLGEGFPDAGIPARRERGLLMLYLLDPEGAEAEELKDADPVVAWAISFPSSTSERRVSNSRYIANSVLWGGLNEWVD